jgi:hypothetical protein
MPMRPKSSSGAGARPKSSRDKVRAYRARMRAQGFRQIQIWVPDTRTPEFKREAHRQSLMIARSEHEAEDQAFVDSISEWNDD